MFPELQQSINILRNVVAELRGIREAIEKQTEELRELNGNAEAKRVLEKMGREDT